MNIKFFLLPTLMFLISFSLIAKEIDELQVYKFSKPEEKITGFIADKYIELVNQGLLSHKMKIVLIGLPQLRSLYEVNKGEIDGDVGRIPELFNGDNPEFSNIYPLPTSIGNYANRAFVLKDSPYQKFSELDKLKTCGYVRGELAALLISSKHKCVEAKSFNQLRTMLDLGRIDYFLVPDLEGFPLYNPQTQKMRMLPDRLHEVGLHPALNVRHRNSSFEKVLTQVINGLKEKGFPKKLLLNLQRKNKSK